MKLQNEANNVRKSFEANLSEQSDRARRAESAKGTQIIFFHATNSYHWSR